MNLVLVVAAAVAEVAELADLKVAVSLTKSIYYSTEYNLRTTPPMSCLNSFMLLSFSFLFLNYNELLLKFDKDEYSV